MGKHDTAMKPNLTDSDIEDESEWMSELDRERIRNAVCTVCNLVWVDVMSGEDTCKQCLPNQ